MLAGCGCENTEFGCCSDERTPAKGPNFAGCTCDTSQFGCCPDGIEEAQGENFEGCLTVPSMPGVACGLAKDRGSCRDFTVKWYYDTDYGGCSRFWYGGCKGNDNRFKTQEECKEVCVQPKGKGNFFTIILPAYTQVERQKEIDPFCEIIVKIAGERSILRISRWSKRRIFGSYFAAACFLPKIAGPCQGYHPTWYFDAERKQCGQFVYGGCLGNNNKFKTKEECEELCVTPDGVGKELLSITWK